MNSTRNFKILQKLQTRIRDFVIISQALYFNLRIIYVKILPERDMIERWERIKNNGERREERRERRKERCERGEKREEK